MNSRMGRENELIFDQPREYRGLHLSSFRVLSHISAENMRRRLALSVAVIIAYATIHQPMGYGSGKRYKNAGKGYSLRLTYINGCAETPNSPLIHYIKLVTLNNSQSVSSKVFFKNSINMNEVRLLCERCLDYNYGCEKFVNWTFKNPCPVLTMKNQPWTPIADAISPREWKRTCPYVEKGTYSIKNSAIDLEAAVRFMPDILKYKWRMVFKAIENKRKKLEMCVVAEGHAVEYTKRVDADEDGRR